MMNLRTLTVTIFLLLIVAMGTALAVVPPFTSVVFEWEKAPSHGPDISFVLKWGTTTNSYQWSTNVGPRTSIAVTNPTTGTLYFIVVARTPDGIESEPSNLVTITNFPAAPLRLQMSTNTTTGVRLEGTIDGNNWIHLATVDKTNSLVTIPSASKMMLRTVQFPPLP